MAFGVLNVFGLTRGELRLVSAYLSVSVLGALLGLLVARTLGVTLSSEGIEIYAVWMAVAGGLGSATGLFLAGERFGQPGIPGLRRAIIASIWVSFFGSIIGGTLILPFYGTMFGPFTFALTLAVHPWIGLLWFGNLLFAHHLLSRHRKERESIFETLVDGPRDGYRRARPGSF